MWGRSATGVYAGGQGVLLHSDGTQWTSIALPEVGASIQTIWGTPTELFVATTTELFRYDGTAWLPVASGTPNRITAMAGIGDSIFYTDYAGGWHQLVRLSPGELAGVWSPSSALPNPSWSCWLEQPRTARRRITDEHNRDGQLGDGSARDQARPVVPALACT